MERTEVKSAALNNGEEHSNAITTEDDSPQPALYATWLNAVNSCWLDASLALIANNKTMRRLAHQYQRTKIYDILLAYDKATLLLNCNLGNAEQRLAGARLYLLVVRTNVLRFLQPKLKCEEGEPDSAFCSLLNIIMEDKDFEKHFEVTWLWTRKCAYCNSSRSWKRTKSIITIPKTNGFDPENPTCLFKCACSDVVQEMKLVYVDVPPCLIFHFENGIGRGVKNLCTSFIYQNVKFEMTSIVMLQEQDEEGQPDHFITWVRNPDSDEWLECNDLNDYANSFSSNPPRLHPKEIYMLVYEADYDGKLTCPVPESIQLHSPSEDIPCVDISSESDSSENESEEKNSRNGQTNESDENNSQNNQASDLRESSGSDDD